ncbi:MAG: class SAM-dependent methyltransferase, partial [Rubritepida sp.]|nr:class SAM-dependent methyltransferase [Rubritepida sp.]
SARLIELWEKLSAVLPEPRSCELAAGLALDLLERREWDLAIQVLDRAVRDSPSAPGVVAELGRLLRKTPGNANLPLMQVLAYLRAEAPPAALMRAAKRAEAPAEAAKPATPADTSEREAALTAAKILGASNTPGALAIRHVAFHGMPGDMKFRQLHTALQSCIELSLPSLAEGLAPFVPGARIIEIDGSLTLNATLLRALGAQSYVGIVSEADRVRRSFRNPLTLARVRSSFAATDLEGLDPAISFVSEVGPELSRSADLVIARPDPVADALDRAVEVALGLLKPGGRLILYWRNPRSWSGHGRVPQTVVEMKPKDAEQAKVMDWAHLAGIRASVPSFAQVRGRLESQFIIEGRTEELDDPAAVIRLTPRLRRSHPKLESADFTMRMVAVTARARP